MCPICDHNFSQKASLKKQIDSVHVSKNQLKCYVTF